MEISDGKLGALVFHLARLCPEALLLPMRDGAGNITLCGWEAHGGGRISQSGHGPVDLSASGLGLSDTTSLTGGFITLAWSCGPANAERAFIFYMG